MKGLLRFNTGVTGGEKHGNQTVNSIFLTYLFPVFFPFQSLHLHTFLPQKKGEGNWFILSF